MIEAIEKLLEKDEKGYLVYQGEDFPYDGPIDILNYHHFLSTLRQN